MYQKDIRTIERYIQKNRKWKRWQKIGIVLACIVVFCTTYAIILPAITINTETFCGLEEHPEHTEECYRTEQVLICGLEENDVHVHTEECTITENIRICGTEESLGHIHSEDCFTLERTMTCGLEENSGHVHDIDCYVYQENLICTNEDSEHVHGDECYSLEQLLACTTEEGAGAHYHTDECFTEEQVLSCGLEEGDGAHQHSAECYVEETVYICGLEEGVGAHHHTEECYREEQTLVCDKPIHTHTTQCYADLTADVEDSTDWENALQQLELSGCWQDDVVLVAGSQLGYSESEKNFLVDEDGNRKGYTRYGAWYGNTYGDWDAMFVSFCIRYAGIGREVYPIGGISQNWLEQLNTAEYPYYYAAHDQNIYEGGMINESTGFEPEAGNIIFLNLNGGTKANHVGIVSSVTRNEAGEITSIKTIEGDTVNHKVEYAIYQPEDAQIIGFAVLPENPNGPVREIEIAESEETEINEIEEIIEEEEITEEEEILVTEEVTDADESSEEIEASDEEESEEETEDEEESEEETEDEEESEEETEDEEESEEETEDEEESEEETEDEEESEEETEDEEEFEEKDTIAGGLVYSASYDGYKVTVTFEEDTEIPAGAELEAELITGGYDIGILSDYLANDYTYAGMTVYNIRFAVDGEEYIVDAPADVVVEVDAESQISWGKTVFLQLDESEITKLSPEVTEKDGRIHYHYSQEKLTKAALVTGAIGLYTLEYYGADYRVTAAFTDEAELPEDVKLVVTEIFGDEFRTKCEELSAVAANENIQYVRIFDIAFVYGGIEYEPQAPVKVQIIRNDLADISENAESGIVHFGEDQPEYIESDLTTADDGTASIEFESTSFSSFASYVSDPFEGQANTPGTIATVDTKALGLTINMFDYWGDGNNPDSIDKINNGWTNGSSNYDFNGVNSVNHYSAMSDNITKNLLFSASGASFNNESEAYQNSLNAFTGGDNGTYGPARQGIVNITLGNNGYPVLATNGNSLDYLFNTTNYTYKTTYENLNHLFKVNDAGNLYYSSNDNYAYLDTNSGNFKVYSETYENSDSKDDEKSYIGFFPFNEYNTNRREVKSPAASNVSNKYYNHHFGLTLSGSFVMPDNRQIDGKDIIFNFSGDDDMWLYIDGVLVLDIGGIHQPCSGSVNLTTGAISIFDAVATEGGASYTMGTSNTIQNLFARAGRTWDDSPESRHSINVFYLERGGCYSNLTMEMNFPFYDTIPVKVTKDVEGEYKDDVTFLDKDYTFRIMVETVTGSGNYSPYQGELNISGNGNTRRVTTDESGYFTIKAGETAETVSTFLSTRKYYVQEIGLNGELFEVVRFVSDAGESQEVIPRDADAAQTQSAPLYISNHVTVDNVIRETRTKLTVDKVWFDGYGVHADDTVKFKVWVKDINDPEAGESLLQYEGATEFILNTANNWVMTFNDLLKETLGHEFTYRVEEVEIKEGYRVTYEETEDGDGNVHYTIDNREDYFLNVEKEWYGVNGDPIDGATLSVDQITVNLYRTYQEAAGGAVTVKFITGNNEQYNTFEADVTSVQVGKGGSITFIAPRWQSDRNLTGVTVRNGTAAVTQAADVNGSPAYTISNIQSDITVYLTISELYSSQVDGVKNGFKTISRTEPTSSSGSSDEGVRELAATVVLNKGNSWSYSWTKSELHEQAGRTYKYFVEETEVPVLYSASYENNDGISSGTIIVKNTRTQEYELPHTGGLGTGMLYMAGLLLLVLVGMFSIRRYTRKS